MQGGKGDATELILLDNTEKLPITASIVMSSYVLNLALKFTTQKQILREI